LALPNKPVAPAAPAEELRVFFDVNVYIDAILYWHTKNPQSLALDNLVVAEGAPAALALAAAAQNLPIHGRHVSLWSSDHVLDTLVYKLTTDPKFARHNLSNEIIDDFLDQTYTAIERSGGQVIEKGRTQPQLQLNDPEDNRVLGDAVETDAHLLVTSDNGFLDLVWYGTMMFISPSTYAHRAQFKQEINTELGPEPEDQQLNTPTTSLDAMTNERETSLNEPDYGISFTDDDDPYGRGR
jgi:predicted nucleic acid-binding protein